MFILFVYNYWLEIIYYNIIRVHMCYKCLACESNMASILNLIVGSSVDGPLSCPFFPYVKEVDYPLSLYRAAYFIRIWK